MGFVGYLAVLFIISILVHWFLRTNFFIKSIILVFGGPVLAHLLAGILGYLDSFFLLTMVLSILYSVPVAIIAGLVVLAIRKLRSADPISEMENDSSGKK